MRERRTRLLAEIAVGVALSAVLGMLRLYRLPWGGSLSLKILPLLLLAIRRGPVSGLTAGGLAGLITLALDPFFLHPLQVVLDYFLPYMAIGMAGGFPGRPRLGIVLTGMTRLALHVISGVVYFSAYAPPEIGRQTYLFLRETVGWAPQVLTYDGAAAWVYSLLYNGSVVVPETLIMVFLLPPLATRIARHRG
ncbi:MAG: energy-coupled thiamine transporter ThiT [candidate division Zixibacteria bacterium]|nr:energy-coupled thiamine transporter ThiT [candidate division Zixibacteria bacterium]